MAKAAGETKFAPGLTVEVRDEEWLITQAIQTQDGWQLQVRGLSDYVRDTTATFYDALDEITVFDPAEVTVVPDRSAQYRHTRLWLETTIRQTPVPLYHPELTVSPKMLADPLEYQRDAVRQALSADIIRPRILLADAVGLGKTLEIGFILSELIRRGRGDRILVVTPKHVLEQMQQELWTRFAIPLVRLDSMGIQKVRQKLPASRNPFTYFPRVIISMDTIKSPKYRAQLEKVHWDAVVIDEIHNATNAGTQNNALARVLAPTTEALILASATPHNGDPESFREILRFLDPTSVLPDGTIDSEAARRLIIRRHRNSPEVSSIVGNNWAVRAEPNNILVDASPEENAVADELHYSWIANSVSSDRLFPWTLVKAFLSSPAALTETVTNRLKKTSEHTPEHQALQRLSDLTTTITPKKSAKYQRLVDYLKSIGVAKGSTMRVVVFSERVATLTWLAQHLAKDLKLAKGSIAIMHGGLSDQEQMRLVDEFKREDSPIRILITGDVASEGVNLHAQCHQLIHYDIPWSLIRIQQRNGRIDRYGQQYPPVITTLLLDPASENSIGEVQVLARLMEREHAAYKVLGDASSLMGEHSIKREEDAIREVLRGERDFDATVAKPEEILAHTDDNIDALLAMFAEAEATPIVEAPPLVENSLYANEIDYLADALNEAFHTVPSAAPAAGGIGFRHHDNEVANLIPPPDLQRRIDFLPQDYVSYRKVKEKMMLATSTRQGNQSLQAAREGQSESTWPEAHYLGPLHPVSQWAADRALTRMGRREIPAATAPHISVPTVLLMATLTNNRGQVVSRAFVIANEGDFGVEAQVIPNAVDWLTSIGLGSNAVNTGQTQVDDSLIELVAEAVRQTKNAVNPMQNAAAEQANIRVKSWRERMENWEAKRNHNAPSTWTLLRSEELKSIENELKLTLNPSQLLVRPLLAVLPIKESS